MISWQNHLTLLAESYHNQQEPAPFPLPSHEINVSESSGRAFWLEDFNLWLSKKCPIVFRPIGASSCREMHGSGGEDVAVLPATVGGTWYPKLFQRGDEQKTVILHFHGGSFLWGTGRESDCGAAASTMLKRIPATALFVQYRLASNPTCTFPAAVQDAVTAYKYLLSIEIPASNIVISGDSAGGNVAIALLRYLSSADGNRLSSPSAALLWSSSVDLVTQCDPRSIDLHRNNKSDYITGFTLVWGVKAYIPRSMESTHPYFSPLNHPFSISTPLWIMVGGAEVLYDTIVGFADQMRRMQGNRVTLYEAPNAPHDIILVGHVLGWVKEADVGAQAAAEFLEGLASNAKS